MLISVITAVRNAAQTVHNCLASIQRQTVAAEHIVVDGRSSDGTLGVLARAQNQNPWLSVVSEADRGIYDAMGKGIAHAKGDVVGFLNADDFYADARVLERVLEVFSNPEVDSSYGDLVYVRAPSDSHSSSQLLEANGQFHFPEEQVVRRWRAGSMTPSSFYWGWMPPHPTFFVRRSVYEQYGSFRLDLGTAADYELMLRFLLKHRISTQYLSEVLVRMSVGGVSNASLRNRLLANWHDRRAWTVNGLRPYPWTLMLKPLRKLGQWMGCRPCQAGTSESEKGTKRPQLRPQQA